MNQYTDDLRAIRGDELMTAACDALAKPEKIVVGGDGAYTPRCEWTLCHLPLLLTFRTTVVPYSSNSFRARRPPEVGLSVDSLSTLSLRLPHREAER